jgi:hypothetical protein
MLKIKIHNKINQKAAMCSTCIEVSKNTIIISIARSNEILGWEGVGNRQLLFF